ncbi:MAG: hypothetical protein M3P50_00130, partial [Actinomycetota bacterium]|nr:hypothetical protein [Actinomycetota bacterium]
MDADEEGSLLERQSRVEVLEEQRHEAGMDWHDALAAALGDAHADEPAAEVDVVPVESEQLGAPQAGVGEQCGQQAVALALAGMLALP